MRRYRVPGPNKVEEKAVVKAKARHSRRQTERKDKELDTAAANSAADEPPAIVATVKEVTHEAVVVVGELVVTAAAKIKSVVTGSTAEAPPDQKTPVGRTRVKEKGRAAKGSLVEKKAAH